MGKIFSIIILLSLVVPNISHANGSKAKLSEIMKDAIVYGASDDELLKMARFIDAYVTQSDVDKTEKEKLSVIQDKLINYFLVKRTLTDSKTESYGSQRLVINVLRSTFIDDEEPELRLRKELPGFSINELVGPKILLESKIFGSSSSRNEGTPLKINLKGIDNRNFWKKIWVAFHGKKSDVDNSEINKIGLLYDFEANLWLKSAKNSLKTLMFYGHIYPEALRYTVSASGVAKTVCSIGKDSKSLCTDDVYNELNFSARSYQNNELRKIKSYSPQDIADELCSGIRNVVLSNPMFEEMGCNPKWYETLTNYNDNGVELADTRFRHSKYIVAQNAIPPFASTNDPLYRRSGTPLDLSDLNLSSKKQINFTQNYDNPSIGSDYLNSINSNMDNNLRNNVCTGYTTSLLPLKSSGTGLLLLTTSLQGLNCNIYSDKNRSVMTAAEVQSIDRNNIKLVKSAVQESVNMVLDHVEETNKDFRDSFVNSKKGKPYTDSVALNAKVIENIKKLINLNPIAAAQVLVSYPAYLPGLAVQLFEQIDADKKTEEIVDGVVRIGTYVVGGVCAIAAIVAPYAGVPVLAAYAGVLGTTSTVLFIAGTSYSGMKTYQEYNTYVDVRNVIQSQNGDNLSVSEMQAAYTKTIDLAYETAINTGMITLSSAISLMANSAKVTTELGTADDLLAFEKQGTKTPLSTNSEPSKGGYYKVPSIKVKGTPTKLTESGIENTSTLNLKNAVPDLTKSVDEFKGGVSVEYFDNFTTPAAGGNVAPVNNSGGVAIATKTDIITKPITTTKPVVQPSFPKTMFTNKAVVNTLDGKAYLLNPVTQIVTELSTEELIEWKHPTKLIEEFKEKELVTIQITQEDGNLLTYTVWLDKGEKGEAELAKIISNLKTMGKVKVASSSYDKDGKLINSEQQESPYNVKNGITVDDQEAEDLIANSAFWDSERKLTVSPNSKTTFKISNDNLMILMYEDVIDENGNTTNMLVGYISADHNIGPADLFINMINSKKLIRKNSSEKVVATVLIEKLLSVAKNNTAPLNSVGMVFAEDNKATFFKLFDNEKSKLPDGTNIDEATKKELYINVFKKMPTYKVLKENGFTEVTYYNKGGVEFVVSKPKRMPPADRVNIFNDILKEYGDTQVALLKLFQDRDFLPQGGTVAVVGPSADFYEWLVPLLTRDDIKVVISERRESFPFFTDINNAINSIEVDDRFSYLMEIVKDDNPGLIENSHIKTAEDLFMAINKQVTPYISGIADPYPIKELCDVMLFVAPRGLDIGQYLSKNLKPDGVAWVITEDLRPVFNNKIIVNNKNNFKLTTVMNSGTIDGKYNFINLKNGSNVAKFFPSLSHSFGGRGRFWGSIPNTEGYFIWNSDL